MNNEPLVKIYGKLICLACNNASLAETDIPIAKELKNIIAMLSKKGLSENEIIDYMIKNYSDFVYLNTSTHFHLLYYLVWLFPVLASFFFAYVILRIYNKKSKTPIQLELPFDF